MLMPIQKSMLMPIVGAGEEDGFSAAFVKVQRIKEKVQVVKMCLCVEMNALNRWRQKGGKRGGQEDLIRKNKSI